MSKKRIRAASPATCRVDKAYYRGKGGTMSIDLYLAAILIVSGLVGLAITVIGGLREMRRGDDQ